jgi:hypothetical protein
MAIKFKKVFFYFVFSAVFLMYILNGALATTSYSCSDTSGIIKCTDVERYDGTGWVSACAVSWPGNDSATLFVTGDGNNCDGQSFSPKPYSLIHITNNDCEAKLNGFMVSGNFNLGIFNQIDDTNFCHLADLPNDKCFTLDDYKNNYYMKAFVFLRVYSDDPDDSLSEFFVFPDKYNGTFDLGKYIGSNVYSYIDSDFIQKIDDYNDDIDSYDDYIYYNEKLYDSYDEGSSDQNIYTENFGQNLPFIYLTPREVNYEDYFKNSLDLLKKYLNENVFNSRKYTIELEVIPVDLKCDDKINDLSSIVGSFDIVGLSYDSFLSSVNIGDGFMWGKKARKSLLGGSVEYEINKEYKDIPVNEIPNSNKNITIKIYNESSGKNVYNETLDVNDLTLLISSVKPNVRNVSEAVNIINKSFNLMLNLDIEKYVYYNESSGKTTITLKVNNPSGQSIHNLTIYQVFSKDQLSDIKNLKVIKGKDNFFVSDADPVVGWYFDDTSNTEVSYEENGDTSGGAVVITQEPVLLNEGNLIINYRSDGCNADEVNLFDLDSLNDSKIHDPGTSNYQVCIKHLNVTIYSGDSHPNYLSIGSYKTDGNFSTNISEFSNLVALSTDNTSVYWHMKIQKDNPDGNFSCLGSIKYKDGSTEFGDCSYNPDNRIWLHLGADYYPPKVQIYYPYLSHKMQVYLYADDGYGSGVKNITYNIDNGPWVTVNSNSTQFYLTCENDWGCIKHIKYFACDNAGNCGDVKNYDLTIIDKGSACQADCTAKPSPNRYLAECRNLNGCKYYPINSSGQNDNGLEVAKKCNMLTVGSWVRYNSTHDIKCPDGPFRKSIYTNKILDLLNSKCDYVIKKPYSVILNGDTVLMDLVFCINRDDFE